MKKSLLISLTLVLFLSNVCLATTQNVCTVTGCADLDFSRDRGAIQFTCSVTKGRFLFSSHNIKIVQGNNKIRLHPFFGNGIGPEPQVQCDDADVCLKTVKQNNDMSGTIRCLPKWFNISEKFTLTYKDAEFQFDTASDNSTFTVIEHMIAKEVNNGTCTTPVPNTTFSKSDSLVASWLSFKNAKINDILEWRFYGPHSVRYDCHQFAVQYESGCNFWGLYIKGSNPQYMPGNWSVEVYYNGILQFTDTFTIKSS